MEGWFYWGIDILLVSEDLRNEFAKPTKDSTLNEDEQKYGNIIDNFWTAKMLEDQN